MFGNGLSSSPSNTPDYPSLVTCADNVHAQRRLLHDEFGIEHLAAVYGWSMGAQQAYHWAALSEGRGSDRRGLRQSRTAVHNRSFSAMAAILEAAPEHLGGGASRHRR
jgi:homoserine O-acetyltransferase